LLLVVGFLVGCSTRRSAASAGGGGEWPACSGSCLYVDAQDGNDATGDGTMKAPYQSLAQVNAIVQPGVTVVLRGTFVNQAIAPSRSGTADAPITYLGGSGASLVGPGDIAGSQHVVYLNERSYVKVDNVSFSYVSYWQRPLTGYSGVHIVGGDHNAFARCEFEHVPVLVDDSDDNMFLQDNFHDFSASYVNSATGLPDPKTPTTNGHLLQLAYGSDRNTIQYDTFDRAGGSAVQVGNGINGGTNADNVISLNDIANTWYRPVGLDDDGAGTVLELNRIHGAATVPTVRNSHPGSIGTLVKAAVAVQISGKDFVVRNNVITDNVVDRGTIVLGSRWYYDVNNPNGVLVESLDNRIYGNSIYGNAGASSFAFTRFYSEADRKAGKPEPRQSGNQIENNVLWGNTGSPRSSVSSRYCPTISIVSTPGQAHPLRRCNKLGKSNRSY